MYRHNLKSLKRAFLKPTTRLRNQHYEYLRTTVPNLSGIRDWFLEDNFSLDGGETGGGAQVVMGASLTGLPATHLLLYGLVPNGPLTSTGLWPGGWGPLP